MIAGTKLILYVVSGLVFKKKNYCFEQVREWLHSLGIFDMQGSVVQDDEEPDDGALPLHCTEDSVKNRCS